MATVPKKKKLFNKSKCSPVYSSLYIQHAIAIWTKSHSRSTFFFGSPLKAARGFSLTRVYTFFYRGPLLLCCTRTRKRGKYSLFSFFFLLASVWHAKREKHHNSFFGCKKKIGEKKTSAVSLWGDGKIKIKLLPVALLKDICLPNERNVFFFLFSRGRY